MKSIEDIIAVLLSGSILLFSFFYIVNLQAKLFSDLFENKKKLDELEKERLKLEEEHDRIDSFGFHLHSKRRR